MRTLVVALALSITLVPSLAAALTVTTNSDAGVGSLRQALADTPDGGTVDFALVTPVTLTLASELLVERNVTITSPGASALTVDGNDGARVFHLSPFAIVTMSDLTIANGDAGNDGGSTTAARSRSSASSSTTASPPTAGAS